MTDYKLVPVEPTEEMVLAGAKEVDWYAHNAGDCYRAMLAAAPAVQGEAVAVMYEDGSLLSKADCGDNFEICCKVQTPLYAAPQPAEQQPAPDVAALVEVLETALFGTPLDDVPNRDNDDIWCMCYPHLPERASDALRDHLARIETALAAHLKGGEK